ncbi:ParB/RepB/Spo0J family partition protein [Azohydromonas australica]|uniref:ParB/RepB/Spo0J family partition protein n=1 Tax=Azohydromonas australica TaxID=364039 RepID=UPI0003FC1BEB|nr:ParB/RepB/Spo0J family partition protein [Azohydromonas australica]
MLELPDLDLGALNASAVEPAGTPLQLRLDAIDEDPNQPRMEFDQETLQELADNIRERGVRQPVSVRSHPTQPGRYMLNFGARRLRASRMAGKETIPAFVDETANDFDQVAENEQRKGLTPLELALFVKKKLDEKMSQGEIARRLGKSRPLITYACALIDAPDWVMNAYRSGKCQGLFEINELRKLYEAHPDAVEQWGAGQEAFTRTTLARLKTQLGSPAPGNVEEAAQVVNGLPATTSPAAATAPVNGLPVPGVQTGEQQPVNGLLPQEPAGVMDVAVVQGASESPADSPTSAAPADGQDRLPRPAPARATGLRVVVRYGETLMEVATDAKPRKDRIPVRPLGSDEGVQHVAPGKLQLVRVETP